MEGLRILRNLENVLFLDFWTNFAWPLWEHGGFIGPYKAHLCFYCLNNFKLIWKKKEKFVPPPLTIFLKKLIPELLLPIAPPLIIAETMTVAMRVFSVVVLCDNKTNYLSQAWLFVTALNFMGDTLAIVGLARLRFYYLRMLYLRQDLYFDHFLLLVRVLRDGDGGLTSGVQSCPAHAGAEKNTMNLSFRGQKLLDEKWLRLMVRNCQLSNRVVQI